MLYLNLNSTNEIFITAKDLVETDSPVYFFAFTHQVTSEVFTTTLDNLEPDNHRFDKFELVLPDDLDLPVGKYKYVVTLTDANGEVLDSGAAEVLQTETTDPEYDAEVTDKVYDSE